MSSPTLLQALSPQDHGDTEAKRVELAEIDQSCRGPVLLFFSAGLLWLIIGTIFALVASYKLHNPAFLGDSAPLTFGIVRTVHLDTVIYGFASEVAIGVTLWIMCRLCRSPLVQPAIINVAAVFWNLGLAIGLFGILAGDSTSIEWLELPAYSTPILFVAYALVGVWAVITFRFRRERRLYVSQWYLLAAVLWFPWIYSTAQIMLILDPVRGVTQAAVNWWFAHNVLGLWFTPIGLATVYYLIPKVIGRPIHSYYLSILGFWTFALFYNWNGFHHLVGGPLPAWMITVSIVASVMMLIPVVTVAINHHFTMVGHFGKLRYSPTLRFVVFGAMAYTVVSLQGVVSALRSFSEVAHFTHHTVAHSHLGLYGFFAMTMFGAIYYIAPRLTRREWPSQALISIHFWTTAVGIAIYVVFLAWGGWQQGRAMLDAKIPFLKVVEGTLPYLRIRTFAGLLMALGHVAFLVNFGWILARCFGPYRQPQAMILRGTEPAAAGK